MNFEDYVFINGLMDEVHKDWNMVKFDKLMMLNRKVYAQIKARGDKEECDKLEAYIQSEIKRLDEFNRELEMKLGEA